MKEIEIYGDYIQLDQFLKKENMISSGGETGDFIKNHEIFLNGSIIQEKRKKIRLGDELSLDGEVYRIIEAKK
ncbi:RNA-binding S4 domain-containing protein [Dialister invisus]|uniref:RNA-binding S4 domain-containing protein n=1 Tax=Dialister invisus TaxID=218538 RepID=UPI003522E477